MSIVHSEDTAVAVLPADVDADVAGAFFRESHVHGEPDVFAAVTVENIDKVLNDENPDRAAMHVLGASAEQIMTELLNRYPSPVPESTLIIQSRNLQLTKIKRVTVDSGYAWRRRNTITRSTVTYPLAWIKLNWPLLRNPESVDELQALSTVHGPLVLSREKCRELFGKADRETVEAEGFIYVPVDVEDLVRINYNPGAFRRRDYTKKLKRHLERTAYGFPDYVYHRLYRLLSNWPSQHPLSDVVTHCELYKRSGWNHETPIQFKPGQIATLIKYNQRLLPNNHFWRESSRPYYNRIDFAPVLTAALAHLHGTEAAIATARARDIAEQRGWYDTYLTRFAKFKAGDPEILAMYPETNSAFHGRETPISFEEFTGGQPYQSSNGYRAEELAVICRFLRKEAKALKIKLPRPSRPPAKPRRQRAKKTRPADTATTH